MQSTELGPWLGLARSALVLLASAAAGSAAADPVAFVVNEDSNSVSVVDVLRRATLSNISTLNTSSDGFAPTDVVFDPVSGRVFVSARELLVSFDGRTSDGSGWSGTELLDEASGIALDELGRRLFVSHEKIGIALDGFVSEFSLADPFAPRKVKEHVVKGIPDLRFIAWDAYQERVYAVDDDGRVARTGRGDMTFTQVSGASAPNPGGILANPSGGVFISSRSTQGPGRILRVSENGSVSVWPLLDGGQPRGLAFDAEVAGALLIAVDDRASVVRLSPATGTFSHVMATDPRPFDVARTATGTVVSVNRIGSSVNGSVTAAGVTIATTGVKSTAMALVELPQLTATPPSHAFCYMRLGNRDRVSIRIQNTRMSRQTADLAQLQIGGANPANYTVISNQCSAARLTWGKWCHFTLEFRAGGPSVEGPPPPPSATWPAQVSIATTDGSASVTIPLHAYKMATLCPWGQSK